MRDDVLPPLHQPWADWRAGTAPAPETLAQADWDALAPGGAARVAAWLGDVRAFFPAPVVQVVQRDAFERLNLKRMLLEPEMMRAMKADVHLVADLAALRAAMPGAALATAREVVARGRGRT